MSEEETSFKFQDRRRFSPDTGEIRKKEEIEIKETPKPEEKTERATEAQTATPPPEVNFTGFIIGLSTQAIMFLGVIPDPHSGKSLKDLPAAKQLIDILGMLKEKTAGNLSKDEEKLFDRVLYDLRNQFVEVAGNP